MREDFPFEFPGFGNCPSRCHIRILSGDGKPVVVIVSQVKTRPGTSVMNAYEIIRGYIYEYLAKQRTERLKADAADELSGMADTFEKCKKLRIAVVVYLLRLASRALKHEVPIAAYIQEQAPDIYWIEHWPTGTGLQNRVQYLKVSENEVGSASWDEVNIKDLATQLGYNEDDVSIPDNAVA